MSNTAGKLGEMYDLDPDTVAGLGRLAPDPVTPQRALETLDRGDGSTYSPQAHAQQLLGIREVPDEATTSPQVNRAPAPQAPITVVGWDDGRSGAPQAGDGSPAPQSKLVGSTLPVTMKTALAAGIERAKFEDKLAAASPQAMSGGGYWKKGEWVPVSHDVQKHNGLSPDEMGQLTPYAEGSIDASLDASRAAGTIANNRILADTAISHLRAVTAQDEAQRAQVALDNRNRYVQEQLTKLDAMAAKTQAQVDPNQIWGSGASGTLAQVTAAIMVGAGQFAASWHGGENAAKSIIDGAIDRNIKAQMATIDGARQNYAIGANLYAENLAAFDNKQKAEVATRLNYVNATIAQIDDITNQSNAPYEMQLKAASLKKQFEDEALGLRTKMVGLAHADVTEKSDERYHPAQYIGGGGEKSVPRSEHLVRLPDGTTLALPGSSELHKSTVDKIQSVTELLRLNDELMKARSEMKQLTDHPIDNRDQIGAVGRHIDDLTRRIVYAENSATADGSVVRESEYPKFEASAGGRAGLGVIGSGSANPMTAYAPGVDDQLDRKQQYLREFLDRTVAASGGAVVQLDYTVDPQTGEKKPTMRYLGKDTKPGEQVAPGGSVSMDSKRQHLPTAPNDTFGDRTPYAPQTQGTVKSTPATNDEPKKGHKKK